MGAGLCFFEIDDERRAGAHPARDMNRAAELFDDLARASQPQTATFCRAEVLEGCPLGERERL